MEGISQLEDLCTDLLILKRAEDEAKKLRVEQENRIAAMIATKTEGADKTEAGRYKITVTSKLTRTLDYPAFQAIESDIPAHIKPVVMKPDIDLKQLRKLEEVMPELVPHFVTSKPAKPQVKVEIIE